MKVICGARASGKTTTLLSLIHEKDSVLLVGSYLRCRVLEEANPELRGRILPWNYLPSQLTGYKNIYIDDVDWYLQNDYAGKVKGISLTGTIDMGWDE